MNKFQVLLLGEYGSSPPIPICLYQYQNQNYYCLEELDALMQLFTKQGHGIVFRVYQQYPESFFLCDQCTFVLAASVIPMARSQNMHALAELCQLTVPEILGGVASPLLSSVGVTGTTRLLGHPRFMTPVPLSDFEAWFISKSQNARYPANPQKAQERLSAFMQQLSHHPLWQSVADKQRSDNSKDIWDRFAAWFGDYPFSPVLLSTFDTRKQQQAIIASRQRRLALDDPKACNRKLGIKKRRSNQNTAALVVSPSSRCSTSSSSSSSSSSCSSPPPPPPAPPSSSSEPMEIDTPPLRRSQQIQPTGRNSPSIIRSWRSVSEFLRPTPTAPPPLPPPAPPPTLPRLSSSRSFLHLPPPWSLSNCKKTSHYNPGLADRLLQQRSPRKCSSLQDMRRTTTTTEDHGNLDLLATQATQQKPMPPTQIIKLPPPSEMLTARPPPPPPEIV